MKIAFLSLLALLISCTYPSPSDECIDNQYLSPVTSPSACIDAMDCGDYTYTMLCFCDNVCLCFDAKVSNCRDITSDTNCKKEEGGMSILDGDFCSKVNLRDVMKSRWFPEDEVAE